MTMETAGGVSVAPSPVMNRAALVNPAIAGPLLVCCLAWALLILWSRSEGGLVLCIAPGPSAGFMASVREQVYLAPPARQAVEWAVMSAAMMAPLALPALVQLGARSYRSLRMPAVLLALAGYLAVWCVVGLPAIALTVAVRAVGATFDMAGVVAVLAGVAAVAWCWARVRTIARRRCHVVPAQTGSAGRIIGMSGLFGVRLGLLCVVICGPAMLALSIAGAGLPLMVALTHVLLAERLAVDPRPRDSALAIGAVLVGVSLMAVSGG